MTYQFSPEILALNPDLSAQVKVGNITPSKYKNARAEARGMMFQSGHEASVIGGLIIAEERKKIFALRLQVRFPLPAGDTIYVADAVYLDEQLKVHVVDAKGLATREYKLKRKMFLGQYGQDIEEL